MTDRIGQQFGNYRLTRFLGEGGFAAVYLGEHIHLNTHVAIKILTTKLLNQEVEQFRHEAYLLAHLNHPNIVRVFDFGLEEREHLPFLVMQYASHGTLRQKHKKGDIVPLDAIVSYVEPVAAALHYAHTNRIVHRDVKPENMLIGDQNEVLLSDFGIALLAQTSLHQKTQELIGTVSYMSPEQIQGKPQPASDQYSLGIVVYEWLSGTRPFQGSFMEVCTQQMVALPTSLRQIVSTIPPEVEQVVSKALAKDPKDRFSTIQEFATAFAEAVEESGNSRTYVPLTSNDATIAARGSENGDVPFATNGPTIAAWGSGNGDVSFATNGPTAIARKSTNSSIPLPTNGLAAAEGSTRTYAPFPSNGPMAAEGSVSTHAYVPFAPSGSPSMEYASISQNTTGQPRKLLPLTRQQNQRRKGLLIGIITGVFVLILVGSGAFAATNILNHSSVSISDTTIAHATAVSNAATSTAASNNTAVAISTSATSTAVATSATATAAKNATAAAVSNSATAVAASSQATATAISTSATAAAVSSSATATAVVTSAPVTTTSTADFTTQTPQLSNIGLISSDAIFQADHSILNSGQQVTVAFPSQAHARKVLLSIRALVSQNGPNVAGYAPMSVLCNGHVVLSNFTMPGGGVGASTANIPIPSQALTAGGGSNQVQLVIASNAVTNFWLYSMQVVQS